MHKKLALPQATRLSIFYRKISNVAPPRETWLREDREEKKKPSNWQDSNRRLLSHKVCAQQLCYNRCHLAMLNIVCFWLLWVGAQTFYLVLHRHMWRLRTTTWSSVWVPRQDNNHRASNPLSSLEIVCRSHSCLMHPCLDFYGYSVQQHSAPKLIWRNKAIEIKPPWLPSFPLPKQIWRNKYFKGPPAAWPPCPGMLEKPVVQNESPMTNSGKKICLPPIFSGSKVFLSKLDEAENPIDIFDLMQFFYFWKINFVAAESEKKIVYQFRRKFLSRLFGPVRGRCIWQGSGFEYKY